MGNRKTAILGAAVVLMLSASACGARSGSPVASPTPEETTPSPVASPTTAGRPHVTPIADAPAGDTVVNLVADNVRWTETEITVPAGETWTLVLESRDPEFHPHNFTIITGPDFADRVYQTPQVVGPDSATFEMPGLPAGSYDFVCTILNHRATMQGTLTVE